MPSPEINRRIAKVFATIADLLEYHGERGPRVQAYRRAAGVVARLTRPLPELLAAGEHVPGIGKALAKKAFEVAEHGTCRKLVQLEEATPPIVRRLLAAPGIGPRHLRTLTSAFGTDEEALRQAIARGDVARLPGFGPARVQALQRALQN